MNRAIAVARIDGPEAGLAILDRLDLDHYRYFHSTHAELRRRADRDDEAHHASRRALDPAQTKPEQRFLADPPTAAILLASAWALIAGNHSTYSTIAPLR
jgi:RNA polymerase sigma-70 factor, ECF subfamily